MELLCALKISSTPGALEKKKKKKKKEKKILGQVLNRLDQDGLWLKCKFMKQLVEYLGHKIYATRLHPLHVRVVLAIKKTVSSLESVRELMSYLKMLLLG